MALPITPLHGNEERERVDHLSRRRIIVSRITLRPQRLQMRRYSVAADIAALPKFVVHL
jgi:hypothetical protein